MMNMKLSAITVTLGLAVLAVAISGCAGDRVDLVDSGRVTLEKRTKSKVYVAWGGVYQEREGFVVTGVLRRRDTVGLPIKAHVDAEVSAPNGNILHQGRSGDIYVPRRIVGRGQSFKRFKLYFPDIPPRGSKVTLIACSDPDCPAK